jgi:hypothetical protein
LGIKFSEQRLGFIKVEVFDNPWAELREYIPLSALVLQERDAPLKQLLQPLDLDRQSVYVYTVDGQPVRCGEVRRASASVHLLEEVRLKRAEIDLEDRH